MRDEGTSIDRAMSNRGVGILLDMAPSIDCSQGEIHWRSNVTQPNYSPLSPPSSLILHPLMDVPLTACLGPDFFDQSAFDALADAGYFLLGQGLFLWLEE